MGYGGALIWTGLARNLKKQFPDKKIILVNHPSLGNFLLIKKNADLQIYRNNPDIELVTNHIFWSILRPWYYPKKRIVIDTSDKRYHYWINDNPGKMTYRSDGHAIAIACKPFNLPNTELKTRLVLEKKEDLKMGALLKSHGLSKDMYICIEPNAKKTFTANKQWPLEHWQKLVDLVNIWLKEKHPNYKIAQMGVAGGTILDGVINLTGATSFRETKKVIENALLVVANEGGVAHLTASCNTKAVIISNPSLPPMLMAYPQYVNIMPEKGHHNCGLKIPCQVCHDLLKSIDPDMVFKKVVSIISS